MSCHRTLKPALHDSSRAAQFAEEPGSGEAKVAFSGGMGDFQDFAGLLRGTGEIKAQLEEARLPGILSFQALERTVQVKHVLVGGSDPAQERRLRQFGAFGATST